MARVINPNNQEAIEVVELGGLEFSPTDIAFPQLPIINYYITYEEGEMRPFTAACVQLEIDASGMSAVEAYDGLYRSIKSYFYALMVACKTVDEYSRRLIDAVYEKTEQKDALFQLYKHAEYECLKKASGRQSKKIQVLPSNKELYTQKAVMQLAAI